ncbi:MAG: hypothetical protein WDO74_32700 [Pseudomonadota bacterium]
MKVRPGYALALMLLLSGCYDDLDWKTVPGSRGAFITRALWRNSHELWFRGTDPTLVRESSGAWKALKTCSGEGWLGGDFAFAEDGVVWVQCRKLGASTSFKLVRFAADLSSTEVHYPNGETTLGLVQAGNSVRFMGKAQLYARDGDSWSVLSSHPFAFGLAGIGEGPDDFIVEGTLPDDVSGAARWNGEEFVATELISTGSLSLRGGKLFDGTSRVVAGKRITPPIAADAVDRNIRFSSPLDEKRFMHLAMPFSTAFDSATTGGVWLETAADEDLEFLGHAPFSTGDLSRGGGISFFYAVDETTALVGIPGPNRRLVEGQ